MQNVSDLKISAVDQHDVSADEPMHVVWRRGREHDLQIARAGMHLAVQFNRDIAVDHDLAIEAGGQTVALGEPWGQMIVMIVIPAASGFTVVVIITIVPVAFVMAIAVTVVAIIVVAIMVVAIMFVMPVIVVLGNGDGGGEGERQDRSRADPEPIFGHGNPPEDGRN